MIEKIFGGQLTLLKDTGSCDDCVCGCSEDAQAADAGDDHKFEHKEED